MKIIKHFSAAFLLIPAVAFGHPGHEHEGLLSSSHMISDAGPYLITLSLAVLVGASVWLVKRI